MSVPRVLRGFWDMTAARALIHEGVPCFTRVFGFDGGEGLNSGDVPVFCEGFGI